MVMARERRRKRRRIKREQSAKEAKVGKRGRPRRKRKSACRKSKPSWTRRRHAMKREPRKMSSTKQRRPSLGTPNTKALRGRNHSWIPS